MDFEELHQRLLDPGTYPETTRSVVFRETHISRVYLTDTHAYKLKKPLDLGFLDFTTLERRGFFCAEEVRLNRRFAPQTYLGVAELRLDHGRLLFDGTGSLVDYAVKMRRLPDERMLDRLLDDASPDLPQEIARLAGHLPAIIAASPVCRDDGPGTHDQVVQANCDENFRQTVPAIGHSLTAEAHRRMRELTAKQLAGLAPLIRERAACGRVRDGHGDLHARNICMTEPVQVYDCIEFCRRFRVADSAAELAFLLMDLDYRGRRDLGGALLAALLEQIDDPELTALLPFYKGYRAWVRGKVEALLAAETDVGAERRRQARERSRRYFNLALGYQVAPFLLMTSGLMGTGKTTLACALADTTGAGLLRSDVIRKELAGMAPDSRCPDPFGTGIYSPAMSARTYAELLRRAERLLCAGQSVIVDAAFGRAAERQAFLDLAASCGRPARLLYLHCDLPTAIGRLDRRQKEASDASDGRSELLQTQSESFEPVPDGPWLIDIDSSAEVDYTVQEVLCQLPPS